MNAKRVVRNRADYSEWSSKLWSDPTLTLILQIDDDKIKELESAIEEQERKKQLEERKFQEQVKNIDRERRNLQIEHEKKLLILKEREKVRRGYSLIPSKSVDVAG